MVPPARARWGWLGLALILAVALGTRLIGLDGAVTEDEDQWIARAGAFAHGLQTSEWRRTYSTGHPGVTVMWLTVLSVGSGRAAPFERVAGSPDVTVVPGFLAALDQARVPFLVVQAGLVVLATLLSARLFGAGVGLIAGLLLSAEPFWAAVGPVVGMDGLLTGFLTVSLLALLIALEPAARLRSRQLWVGLAGLAFGFAFLSKTTSLLAGPGLVVAGLIAAWWMLRSRTSPGSLLVRGRRAATALTTVAAVWLVVAAVVVWLVWPAMWLSPIGTIQRALTFSADLGSVPHGPGNFLLGKPIADPGPLFYLVALPVRLGPGTVVGLLALLIYGTPRNAHRAVWSLLAYVVLFVGLLMLAAKKVDRYLLPVLPVLGILAAIGFRQAGRHLARFARRRRLLASPAAACLGMMAVVAVALQVWPLVQAGRYPLAAYDPFVGGVRFAEHAIPVGWGDGLDVAADQIRAMAPGREVVTSIWAPLRVSFGAHAPGPVVSQAQMSQADFYVDYVHARQRGLTPRLLQGRKPDAVVTIGGVDYARVYRLR